MDPVYKSTGGGSSTPCIPPCRFRWSPLESVTICAIFNLESPLGCRWSPLGWRLVGRPGSAGSPRSLGHPASSTAIIHHRVYMRVSAIFAQNALLTVRTGFMVFFSWDSNLRAMARLRQRSGALGRYATVMEEGCAAQKISNIESG